MDVTFEAIKKANESIKTTDIKGKDYAEVNQRIKAFRMVYPTGNIKTEMISHENGICIFKAEVGYTTQLFDMKENKITESYVVLGIGHAYEKENSSFINKTSYIENCETSAVGRALGMAGFGIDTSVASFEEVANAIQQQEDDKVISKDQEEALRNMIVNQKIANDTVLAVLEDKGYKKLADIKIKDYMNIVNTLRSELAYQRKNGD